MIWKNVLDALNVFRDVNLGLLQLIFDRSGCKLMLKCVLDADFAKGFANLEQSIYMIGEISQFLDMIGKG
jgi:hypothetical protein